MADQTDPNQDLIAVGPNGHQVVWRNNAWVDAENPSAPLQQPAAPPPTVTQDVKQAIPAGAVKAGLATKAMLPEAYQTTTKALGAAANTVGFPEIADTASGAANSVYNASPPVGKDFADWLGDPNNTYEARLGKYQDQNGPLYQPKTWAGNLAETGMENAPGAAAALLPGGGDIKGAEKIPLMTKLLNNAGTFASATAGATAGNRLADTDVAQRNLPDWADSALRVGGTYAGGQMGMNPAKGVTKDQQDMTNLLQNKGMKLTPGRQSMDPAQLNREGRMQDSPWGNLGVPKQFQNLQATEKEGMTNALLGSMGTSLPPTGQRGSLSSVVNKGYKNLGDQTDAILGGTGPVLWFDPTKPGVLPSAGAKPTMSKDIGNIVTAYNKKASAPSGAIQDYADQILGSKTAPNIGMTGPRYQGIRTKLSKDASDAYTSGDMDRYGALSGMRNTLDTYLDQSLRNSGRGADADKWNQLRDQFQAAHNLRDVVSGKSASSAKGYLDPGEVMGSAFPNSDLWNTAKAGVAKDIGQPLPKDPTKLESKVAPLAAGLVGKYTGGGSEGGLAGYLMGHSLSELMTRNPVSQYTTFKPPYTNNPAMVKALMALQATRSPPNVGKDNK